MASTYSTSLKLTLIGDGDQTGTWGQTTNANFGTLLEQAIVGQTTITMANANYTLTNLNGALDEARSAVLIITGNQNATFSVIVPAVPKLYMVTNSLSASATAYINMTGGTTTQVPNGQTMYLYCTGVIGASWGVLNYVQFAQSLVSGGSVTTGAITCSSLTSSGTVSGTTITASTQFSGPGTGITGTAAGLSIGGTALNITASSNTSLTSLANLATVGTITSGTWSGSFGAVSGANLTNITGANVTGTVANATTAATVSTTVASGAVGTTQTAGTANTTIATTAFVAAAVAVLYPIGSIYTSTVGTNPNTLFGFGTWVQFAAGKFLMGNGNGSYPIATSSGSADAILVSHNHGGITGVDSPDHTHNFSATTSGQSTNHTHSPSDSGNFITAGAGPNPGFDSGGLYSATNQVSNTGNNSVDHTHTLSGTTSGRSNGHFHSIATDGQSGTNANLPPYIVVYMWNRTA